MKADNKDLLIIYDADCPMCQWYTGAFVKQGLLAENGREAYQKIGPYTKTKIDMNKARNHIALLNKNTGEVWYGYQSLVRVLSARWSKIKVLAGVKFIGWIIGYLYNFISYNRKAIIPVSNSGYLDCIPDKNWKYRLAFIALAMLVVEATAGWYFHHFFSGLTRFESVHWRESFLFLAQLLFQGGICWFMAKDKLYEYLGTLSAVSAIGGLGIMVTGLAVWMLQTLGFSSLVPAAVGLGAVLMFMFLEHKRRLKLLGMNQTLSWTWVVFRVVLYFVIFL